MGVAAVSWRAQCEANPNAGVCFLSAPPAPSTTMSAVAKRAPTIPELPVDTPAAPEPVVAEAATTPAPEIVTPLPLPAPAEAEMVAAAQMMNSTFATLSVLKAEINGTDPAPDPLQAAVTESIEQAVAATPVTAPLPEPEPLGAPTKRTVKLIPISPTGTPVTSAASVAIDAADDPYQRAVAQQVAAVVPDPSIEAMAFATPTATAAAGTPARVLEVDDNLVNVRSAPSTDAEKLWVLKRGDEVQALAVAGDWVQVQISEDKVGWMLGEFLGEANLDGLPQEEVASVVSTTPVAPAAEPVVVDDTVAEAAPTQTGGDVRRVTGGGVNVRASASSQAEKIFTLGPGEEVTVTDTNRGWLLVTDDQGRTGWLYEDFVTGA